MVDHPPRGRATRRRLVAAASAVSVAALLATGACGASTAPDGLAPPDAAASVERSLDLSAEQTDCLRGRFEDAPSAAAALVPDEAPSDGDRALFLAAMRACLPPEALATTLGSILREEVPEATAEQAECVEGNVVALAPAEQDRLYLYFANPAGNDVDDVGQAGADLFASCDLLTTTEAPIQAPAPDPATTPVSPPG